MYEACPPDVLECALGLRHKVQVPVAEHVRECKADTAGDLRSVQTACRYADGRGRHVIQFEIRPVLLSGPLQTEARQACHRIIEVVANQPLIE